MSGTRLADEATLEAFDRVLVEHAPAVRECLVHPGLTDSEITGYFEPIGVEPPREALAWWRYFDRSDEMRVEFPLQVLPDFEFISAAESATTYGFYRRLADENAEAGSDPDDAWARQWIPIFAMGTGGHVALDGRGRADGPSALRTVRPDTVFGPDHAPSIAPSLGDLLTGATQWMQRGTCRFEPERRLWWPLAAWTRQSHAERYAAPGAES